jgi:hypothetical protein
MMSKYSSLDNSLKIEGNVDIIMTDLSIRIIILISNSEMTYYP